MQIIGMFICILKPFVLINYLVDLSNYLFTK